MPNLIWENLTDKKCPKCGEDLELRDGTYEKFWVCEDVNCDFKIVERRFDRIVEDILAEVNQIYKAPMPVQDIKKEVYDLIGIADPEKELVTLRQIKEEKVFRLQNEKFKFYEPNGKCEEFINGVGCGDNFVILFSAANGVGKTAAGANIVAHLLWGKDSENPYFNSPLFKKWPFPKKGRIVSDPENLKANLIPTLKEWFPLGRYKTNKSGKQYDSVWTTDSGWEFDIMSYEQDAKEFESATLGWAWFDEPPPEAIFKATVSRMRKGGIIFISETPLYAAWLYDHIIANPDPDLATKGQRIYIEADVEAACKQHGIRGHLEHYHIDRMIAEYSEDEKQARIYGKFQHLIGLRFKAFSRNIHVIKPFNVDFRNFCVYQAMDTHPRNPDMVNWIAVDSKGTKYVVAELKIKSEGGTAELAQRIKAIDSQFRIIKRILEPAAFVKDQHDETGKSLAEKLQSLGLYYFEASKVRAMSDRRIEDALAFQKVNLGDKYELIKAPEIYVFDTCPNTIYEFEHLRWDEWTGKIAEKKGQKEKTVDKDDHAIENIGRILILEPKFDELVSDEGDYGDTPNYDPYDKSGGR
jgi:phage terminase large subunit-like protein/ssDNA-binding Zn-finger/Zn-ribbon topoisomerase 1